MSNFSSARVPQLDGLRGVAIGLVVLFHYASPYRATPFVGIVISHGYLGVDLFFVMSGFLIGGIVIANKEAKNLFSVFYLRRFLRIFPLYYFLLAGVAILVCLGSLSNPGHGGLIPYFLYLHNISVALTHDFGLECLGPTWSLAIEEQFYLMLPILIVLTSQKYQKYMLAMGILIATISRALSYLLPAEYPQVFSTFFTLCRIDELFYGVLFAALIRDEGGLCDY